MLGHTIQEWIGLQKGMVVFFLKSGVSANVGSIVSTLCCNSYQNLFTRAWVKPELWTVSWLLVMTAVFLWIIRVKKTYIPFAWFSIGICLLYAAIPFWVRYLVLLLPIWYLISVIWLKERKWKDAVVFGICFFCILSNLFFSSRIIIPTPEAPVAQFVQDWGNGFFHDMYERVDPETQKKYTRSEFHRLGQRFWYDGQIEKADVAIQALHYDIFQKKGNAQGTVTYITRSLGFFTEEIHIPLSFEDGEWHIVWEWSLLLRDLSEGDYLETTVNPARRGELQSFDKKTIAKDISSYMVHIIPNQVEKEKEEEFLALLESLFGGTLIKAGIHDRYVGNVQPDWPMSLGVIPKDVHHKETMSSIEKLRAFPGVIMVPAYARYPSLMTKEIANSLYKECCSLLYTTTAFDGVKGGEKEYNELLKGYDGGTLVIKDRSAKSKRIILKKDRHDGQDVTARL